MKPLLLDLFCGAGGAGMGYHRAGFEIVGVDHELQPHYPFEFHQADALENDRLERVYAPLGSAVLCPACANGNPDVIGWDDGRLILSEPGQVVIWLGGGTSECTQSPLVVLAW